MRRRHRPALAARLLAGAILLGAACGEKEGKNEAASAARYELSGEVVGVDRDGGRITVAHEAVAGFMDAMTMDFPLADEWAWDELREGDRVRATLVVAGDEYWLEGIVISRPPSGPDTVSGIPDPEPGTEVPDFRLVDQDGEPLSLAGLRGRAVALTFIYTRCPLQEFCPRMTSHFAELERRLAARPELYEKTHLVTVSFDPDYDTPSRLKAYAVNRAGATESTFRHWTFATGEPEVVRALASFFALDYWAEQDQILHTLRTVVIGPDGRLVALYRGNTWSVDRVLADLETAADAAGPQENP